MSKKTVELRIYKDLQGHGILTDPSGKVKNENQPITFTYGDTQWAKHLANLRFLGLCKVEVTRFIDGETEIEIPDALREEVQNAVFGKAKPKLTPEQQRIAELEAKLEAFMSGEMKSVKEKRIKPGEEGFEDQLIGDIKEKHDNQIELTELRKEYESLFGKKGYAGWNAEQLREKINEKKAAK